MSVFRRRPAEQGPTEPEPATVPVSRDPDLAMPPFRPAPGPTAPKEPVMSLPPKPTAPQGAAPTPGVTMPTRQVGRPAPAGAERRTLVVGKGISLQGTVTDAERLVVDGTVESQMIQASELQITPSGVFKGEVQVDDAEIAGVFDGTLTARGSLTIRATGRVLGVARTRKLSVEEGGQLSGRMEMLTEGQASFAPAPHGAAPQYAAPYED
ncbi:bactofilin family protein [Muricoccus pecuniae]|uniref:Cytoskeletal protein CcmA (Bactofilin family) n=1 Tax=Muricoccus pecuniae TaxID=693023 RepID=A0A840Y254_9PROT|nr:cytoskeletal protein CcmA (bactofilin family) [Roseomonas pecuniae]